MTGKACLIIVACGLMVRKLKSEEKKREEKMAAFMKWKDDREGEDEGEDDGETESEF